MIVATKIHPTAIIHGDAELDEGVEIGPYVVIGDGVRIGSNTYVGPHSVIEFSEIGKNNQIVAGAFIGTPPQDLHYKGEKTKLIMGDGNIIRETVSLTRGTTTGLTIIGNNCMFMAYSHIGHDCRIGNKIIFANSVAVAGHVEIGDGAFISALTAIHQFTRIGSLVMLSGGSMANQDVPPFCNAQGDRATLVGLNLVGMKRAGIDKNAISEVKKAYKALFLSGQILKDAISQFKEKDLLPEVKSFIEFCENSKRGLARPRRKFKGVKGEE